MLISNIDIGVVLNLWLRNWTSAGFHREIQFWMVAGQTYRSAQPDFTNRLGIGWVYHRG